MVHCRTVMGPRSCDWTATHACVLCCVSLLLCCAACLHAQLFGDSVDAHLAQHWCGLLQQPLMFTPTGLKGNVAAFAAAVKAQASGSSKNGSDPGSAADTGDGCCKDRDMFYYCKPKDLQAADRISIGMFHLPGVHLEGPYHTVSSCGGAGGDKGPREGEETGGGRRDGVREKGGGSALMSLVPDATSLQHHAHTACRDAA